MIHLDSNAVIAAMNQRSGSVRTRLEALVATGVPVGLSSVVLHELLYGAGLSLRPDVNEEKITLLLSATKAEIAPFDPESARHAADIRLALKRLGQPIGHYDLLIAATARRHGATLITANRREFARVPGLMTDDWAQT
jgi:tRNA(fMet)-specific endonuclease VapC